MNDINWLSRDLGLLLLIALLLAGMLAASCDDDDDDDDDNDTVGDDDDNDDQPFVPYQGMEPAGRRIGELLAISSHVSRSAEPVVPKRDFELERLTEAGVGLLRVDFAWQTIEAQDDVWNFAGYDMMTDLCAQAGIRVNALLDYGVDWAMPDGSHSEIDPVVWADFNGSVAAHFADRIDRYEVWNEPNLGRFWYPGPDPEHYGRLLKAGYTAIHANDPDAMVMFAGMSSFSHYWFEESSNFSFLERVAQSHPDICEYFDALAIHPYTFIQQSSPEWTLQLGTLHWPSLPDMLDHTRGLLAYIGCPDKPIHLTEMGWPDKNISLEKQAAFLARGMMLAASKYVDSFYWYTFWDGSGGGFPETEDHFGLFTHPGEDLTTEAKPSYQALFALNQMLADSRYVGNLGAALGWDNMQQALVFIDDDGTYIISLWHTATKLEKAIATEILLPPGSKNWTLYDQFSEQLDSGEYDETWLPVTLYGSVQYLKTAGADK